MSLIKNWIEKNQKKSNAQKNKLAFILAFLITAVIVVIWIFVKPLFDNNEKQEVATEESSPGLFSFFGDLLKVVGIKD